ncbi:MAG: four helix bundle protein [Bacteroidetes bacterium QH_8_67_23]|nr:MAG: four helix bundle protein [Bacteroidetes bacterium QH_8_67_23]
MPKTNFENLRIYQQSEQLADTVWRVVSDWDYFAKKTVGAQLVRAADSIPANIAEGSGRGSVKQKKHFIRITRGSLYEVKNGFRRSHRRSLLSEQQTDDLRPLIEPLAPMLNAYLSSLGNNPSRENPKP